MSQNKPIFIQLDYSDDYYIQKGNKKVPLPPKQEIIKKASKFAKQKILCYFIEGIFKNEFYELDNNIKNEIFDSLKEDIFSLSQDFYGNYVMQSIIEYYKEKNDYIFSEFIKRDISILCLSSYGCRVVNKLIDFIEYNKINRILQQLKGKLKLLFINQNGNHIIQKIIEKINENEINDIYDAVFKDINELIKDIYGTRVIQAIFNKIKDKDKIKKLIDKMFNNNSIIDLCQNEYSNYIIQYIIEIFKEYIETILKELKGKIIEFSKNKYGCNIIEKLLTYGNDRQKEQIYEEIIENDINDNECIEILMKNEYGNYIIQKIIDNYKNNNSGDKLKEIINKVGQNIRINNSKNNDVYKYYKFIEQKLENIN